MDASVPEHAEALERLRTDLILWLTTVRPDGQPQATPVWFHFDEDSFLMYSRRDAPKLRNIGSDPRVSLHLRGNEIGDDVVIVEGTARVDGGVPPADRVEGYVQKYHLQMTANGWTPESFADDYAVPITVTPSRFRVW